MHIVAYSMGARVALEALLYFDAPFLSLTCISATLEIPDRKKREQKEILWKEKLEILPLEDFIDYWYNMPLFKGFQIPIRRYTQNKDALLKSLDDYSPLKTPPLLDRILECKTPIQFIYKNNDPKALPLSDYRDLHFIKASSHCIHLENPQACAGLININIALLYHTIFAIILF